MAHRKHALLTMKVFRSILTGVVFLIVVVLLMVWLAGGFHQKIDRLPAQSHAASKPPSEPAAGAETAQARSMQVPRVEEAVGTVRAVHETAVAAKLLARITEVNITAGQEVRKGDVLIRLDDADLAARVEQAQSSASAARSARDQAQIEYDRIKQLMEQGAASKIEWDRVQSALKTAEAELQRAEQAVNESETVLSYATIRAPIDGVVIDKRVEVGDTATPGQILLTLYDSTRMQLVASVRESLTRRLQVGQTIGVNIETMGHTCEGRVSEIVPEAEAASRTFLVKVTGPCPPGVYIGMFGRLLIPLDDESVLVIPRSAVEQVGQLELVKVVEDDRLRRRAVKLGRLFGDEVEVLSGLREGERVVAQQQQEGPK
ncbi:MAG: efflux RND transporter periplasmic adaptor subunit [Phycisphaerae bacterium]|nr:efflux RND transporter periplasmic adaptor subunit [Phycisphaerae bacterium]